MGSGDDALPFPGCRPFDQKDGDANRLSDYFKTESFDYLHASQSLEHMHDPRAALTQWLYVVKPGGHLVISIPSWEIYEGMVWPSRFNPDHKSTWSMSLRGSPAPIHILVPEFLKEFPVKVERCRLVDANYD